MSCIRCWTLFIVLTVFMFLLTPVQTATGATILWRLCNPAAAVAVSVTVLLPLPQGVLDELTAEATGVSPRVAATGQPQLEALEEEDVDDPDEPAPPPPPPPPPPLSQPQQESVPSEPAGGDGAETSGGDSVLQLEPGLAEQLQLVLAAQTPGGAPLLTGDAELRVQLQIDSEGRIVGVEALQPSGEAANSSAAAVEPAPPALNPLHLPADRQAAPEEPLARPDREQARTLRQVVAGVLQDSGVTASPGLTCSICRKTFHSQGQWRRHMRGHGVEVQPVTASAAAAGRASHVCADCPATFTSASLLARHRRTHTGERPFKCEHCDRAFSQKNTLRIHMRTHLGERPHTCPFCGYGFAQKGNMRTHIRRAHLKRAMDSLELDAMTAEGGGGADV